MRKIVILAAAMAVSAPFFSLAVPVFAASLPDNTAAFESWEKQGSRKFENQKEINNASDGLDAKKAEMDNRFEEMKKQFDKNGEKMGDDNGFMQKKSKGGINTDDFQKNDPETNLGDLKEKAAKENDVMSSKSSVHADDSLPDISYGNEDFANQQGETPASQPSFLEEHGLVLFAGSLAILGTMTFLFVQGTKGLRKG